MKFGVTEITLENSLYAHSQQPIDEFNNLIAQHEKKLFTFYPNTQINSYVDFYSSVFNYWVHLIETQEICVPKVDKLLLHSFSFEMNKLLEEHPLTIDFMEKKPNNERIFVFTYFFTYHFLYYMYDHMPEELLNRFLQEKETITFYASEDSDMQHQLSQDLYVFRKDFLIEIRTDMQVRYDINRLIQLAIKLTNKYFQQ